MILLFGGTSETSRIAEGLASAGLHVLVSCATAIDLDIGTHEKIRRRAGPLNVDSLLALIADEGVRLFIDATHPMQRRQGLPHGKRHGKPASRISRICGPLGTGKTKRPSMRQTMKKQPIWCAPWESPCSSR